ncbi:uncharacterized protein LOC141721532 isoform X2 [Apium graveolens]|uniref:uncharacterized protein LOC141721532 isoform X2 n=1 Tax=Apium graveolens TaxID=4045 RepID=UPI003D7B8518
MASRFQAASLVASPSYPNAVAWSEENLIAVACGHLVTILNPSMPFGPRGLVTIPPSQPFQIGVIDKKDLLSGCMQPISFHRDTSPCVRSISWSPIGLAPNSGCLLAVCTTEGQVKLFRFPFCEFSAEWVEILDISEMLYKYLLDVNFWESDVYSELFNEQASELRKEHEHDVDTASPVMRKNPKRRKRNDMADAHPSSAPNSDESANVVTEVASFPYPLVKGSCVEALKAPNDKPDSRSLQIVCMPKSKTRSKKKAPETHSVDLISADKYASRSSMLASVVVAWSPLLQTSEHRLASPDDSCDCCSILAIGGKSGMISFWKINKPQQYSILNNICTNDAQLIGVLHAHMSWVTAMSWEVSVSNASNHQLLLATGSSDGSVKIWHCYSAEMLKPSKTSSASFSLFHEVMSVDSVPVSVLSLYVPMPSAKQILLAVGKGSGALEVWTCDTSSRKFHKIGLDDAHGHVVTGIAWAFDGNCLYSCNQDDSVHCWTLHSDSLCKVTLPSNTPGVESSTDVPSGFDLCFGLAVSPGNLVVAVARRFDVGLLDPMYQLRSQKAAVEFFWTGGQQHDNLLDNCSDFNVEAYSGFSIEELVNWEYNIMWSFHQHEQLNKPEPVVVWDVVAALLAFKQFAPKYVDHILAKWLRSFAGSNFGNSPLQTVVSKCLSNISTRQLHLLNIIVRRVILADLKADKVNEENQSFSDGPAKGQMGLWMKLLKSSEKELRERLIYCSFSIIINLVSQSSENLSKLGYWQPAGLAQLENWVNSNHAHIRNSLKVLKSEVKKIKKSKLCSVGNYAAKEQCSYCSAPVPFESPEASFCQGTECKKEVVQKHKMTRCAASMLVNDITPTWFCVCCHRRSSKLAPRALFSMLQYPSDASNDPKITTLRESSKPICVFCGILLQRSQPEFLLAASPV